MVKAGVSTGQPDYSPQHMDGHLICAIDVETTGLTVGYNEIWQVCVLPLGADLKPLQGKLPFYMEMQVAHPDRLDREAFHGDKAGWLKRQKSAINKHDVADLLDEWFNALNLPFRKKIAPLAHNWPFDRGFLLEWLGPANFEYLFHHRYRDMMPAAMFLNDTADFQNEAPEYRWLQLAQLCNNLGVTNYKEHDSLQDCIATAECYRKLVVKHSI